MRIRGSPEVEEEIEEIKTSCEEAQRLKEESGTQSPFFERMHGWLICIIFYSYGCA